MVDSQRCCDCEVEAVIGAAALWQSPYAPPDDDRLRMQMANFQESLPVYSKGYAHTQPR
jgi:hypothetical protein